MNPGVDITKAAEEVISKAQQRIKDTRNRADALEREEKKLQRKRMRYLKIANANLKVIELLQADLVPTRFSLSKDDKLLIKLSNYDHTGSYLEEFGKLSKNMHGKILAIEIWDINVVAEDMEEFINFLDTLKIKHMDGN